MKQKPVIAVTSGEPAGIGPDICLDLRSSPAARIVILGDLECLRERAEILQKKVKIQRYRPENDPLPEVLEVCHLPVRADVKAGILNVTNAKYVLDILDRAYDGIQTGEFAAMVTAPVHKGIINDSGLSFTGHTEYLAEKSHTAQVVMMLAAGGLRVALATTHLPLHAVANAITEPLLTQVLTVLHQEMQQKFGLAQPRILVAGLNPHAGESGHLGLEEKQIIIPVIRKLQQYGLNITGPFPADTIFQPFMLKTADVILTMYHDQGLPVLKYAGFGESVNVTLGLPFIRTSVDHGTALAMAGRKQSSSSSLFAAVATAVKMCKQQSAIDVC